MDTVQITIATTDEALHGMLIAALSEDGFDAFEETESALLAYCSAENFREETVKGITQKFDLPYTHATIAQQNWNAAWEAAYEPVLLDDFCIIRAAFHAPVAGFEHEIIITPKMSFGTGHHATTKAMMGAMKEIDFRGKDVLDFGAGTGILSILAAKLGAGNILAIDHEEWAAENAAENVALNHTSGINVKHGSLEQAAGAHFDIILANINRHILLQYMAEMTAAIRPGGHLLLSGILADDEEIITAAAVKTGLQLTKKYGGNGWLALLFSRPQHFPANLF